MNKLFRVLAIDGGGIKGIVPARFLVELEEIAGKPIADLFDLIVGTSTGGILALGLTKPDGSRRPQHSATALLDLYLEKGSIIFPGGGPPTWENRIFGPAGKGFLKNPVRGMLASAQRAGAPFGGNKKFAGNARYFAEGLESVLAEALGDTRLSAALTEVVIPSYDLKAGMPIFFRTTEARGGAAYDPTMAQVARATSAGPTYFPPAVFSWGGAERILVDGGVFANNPAMIGYVEALAIAQLLRQSLDIMVVSIGTGTAEEQSRAEITKDTVMSQNWLQVARGIMQVVFDGVSEKDHLLLSRLAHQNGTRRYWRFQPVLSGASSRLDNVHSNNLQALSRVAEKMVTQHHADLRSIATLLVEADHAVV